jgi:hypothetical protein
MLVKVLSFGSSWWMRLGKNPNDPHRFTRTAAYYNSTGVRCGAKIRRHWIIPGLIRINGILGFNSHFANRAIAKTFIADFAEAFCGNRLLFSRRATQASVPDFYLLVIRSDLHGQIDFASTVWKSAFTQVIAATQLRDFQETMLLMRPGEWCQTSRGFWQLHAPCAPAGLGRLVRVGESVRA